MQRSGPHLQLQPALGLFSHLAHAAEIHAATQLAASQSAFRTCFQRIPTSPESFQKAAAAITSRFGDAGYDSVTLRLGGRGADELAPLLRFWGLLQESIAAAHKTTAPLMTLIMPVSGNAANTLRAALWNSWQADVLGLPVSALCAYPPKNCCTYLFTSLLTAAYSEDVTAKQQAATAREGSTVLRHVVG